MLIEQTLYYLPNSNLSKRISWSQVILNMFKVQTLLLLTRVHKKIVLFQFSIYMGTIYVSCHHTTAIACFRSPPCSYIYKVQIFGSVAYVCLCVEKSLISTSLFVVILLTSLSRTINTVCRINLATILIQHTLYLFGVYQYSTSTS